ncbi:MAG: polymerase chi subunit [Polaromonas sp.]|nr:polymerase chi subunit [Polaromonas sp.]
MKEIEFHFNVGDKLAYGCRLLRKAYRAGHKAVVTGEVEMLGELDQLLWRFSPTDFLPHCMDSASPQTLAMTPVLLSARPGECPADGVLINLGQAVPDGFTRFERFVELVSAQEEDRQLGRARWKRYKAEGYALKQHDALAPRDGA